MGFFGHSKKYDGLISIEDEKPAVRYVREIIVNAIKSSIAEVEIFNENGNATCKLNQNVVPYVNVRNRIAVMTSTISPLNNTKDQSGIIEVRIGDVAYLINVVDKMNKSGIYLRINHSNPNQ